MIKYKNIVLAQLVGTSSHTPKDCGLNSQSGHVPRLWVQPLVEVGMKGNQLLLSLSFPFTKINIKINVVF